MGYHPMGWGRVGFGLGILTLSGLKWGGVWLGWAGWGCGTCVCVCYEQRKLWKSLVRREMARRGKECHKREKESKGKQKPRSGKIKGERTQLRRRDKGRGHDW